MMQRYGMFKWSFLILLLVAFSCRRAEIVNEGANEVNLFVWRAMNTFYFWEAEIPELDDNLRTDPDQLASLLRSYDQPELLFEDLLFEDDRFSFIVDDYDVLENSFQGTSLSSGLQLGLFEITSMSEEIFGYVQYVVPNSPASEAGFDRGDLFTIVNGEQLTKSNFRSFLFQGNTAAIQLATLVDGSFQQSTTVLEVTPRVVTENPILLAETLNDQGRSIGYLVYNQFVNSSEQYTELNQVFAQFKQDNITELVLDLRYNPGGSVETAIVLASLIYGDGDPSQVVSTSVYNADLNEAFAQENVDRNNYFFDQIPESSEALNSLDISRVFILTSGNTASASELVIVGLLPYMDVTLIGTTTVGKNDISATFYDSENLGRTLPRNPNHKYAVQPIIGQTANSEGFSDYIDGLDPDIEIDESAFLENLPALGDPNEPLLAEALAAIALNARRASPEERSFTPYLEGQLIDPKLQTMRVDLPENMKELSKRQLQ
ncbi:MAG: S41 family peptidase [Bacteroidota bacterium]